MWPCFPPARDSSKNTLPMCLKEKWNEMWGVWAHQAPLSMGILQVRILEWVAMPSSRGSSRLRNRGSLALQVDFFFFFFFYHLSHQGSPRILEWVAYPFSKGNCPTQESNQLSWIVGNSLPAELPGKPTLYSLLNGNPLATCCEEMTHWKRPWCWERSKAGGKGDNRGRDEWMASLTWRTWVWASFGSWWWTGKPGVL